MTIYTLPYHRPSSELVFIFINGDRFWGGIRGWVDNESDAHKYIGQYNADRAMKRNGFNRDQRRVALPEVQP